MTKTSQTKAFVRCIRAAWFTALLSYMPVQVSALDSPITRLRHTTWGGREGAPLGAAAMGGFAQTVDGYLWIGNQDGLYQFDGTRFVRYVLPDDTGNIPTSIWSLMPARNGGLWIGFSFGGIGFLKDDRFTFYNHDIGFPAGSVEALAEDARGDVWAATTRGLARFTRGTWNLVASGANYPGNTASTDICHMIVDSDNNVWLGGSNKVYVMPQGASRFEQRSDKFSNCVYFSESPRGSLWADDDSYLQKLNQSTHPHQHNVSSSNLLIDGSGSLWVLAPGHLMRVPDSDGYPVGQIVSMANISDRVDTLSGINADIRQDSEGNIWLSSDEGLARYSPSNVTHEIGADLNAVAKVDIFHPILIVAQGPFIFSSRMRKDWKEAFTYSSGQITPLPEVRNPSAAYRLRNGNVMIGGLSDRLAVYEHDRVVSMISLPDAASGKEVQSIAQEHDGAVWISIVRTGVFKREANAWILNGGINLPSDPAVILADTSSNQICFGYTGNRVSSVDHGVVHNYDVDDGLSLGVVRSIYARREGVWVGGDRGVARFINNRFIALRSRSPHVLDGAMAILETPSGDLWVHCVSGVVRVAKAELARVLLDPSYSVDIETFSESDGILGSTSRIRPLPTAVEGDDGRLWFATNRNIYSIDSTHLHRNTNPPLMHIQRIVADGKEYKPSKQVRLPIRTSLLRIDYAGLDFTTPEKVQYRYKLDGIDSGWQEAGSRVQAFYTNLPPRQYAFHVMAANGSGIWSQPIAVEFEVPPSFIQTPLFKLLCILVLVCLIYLLFQLRLRQVAARLQQRLETRNSERERIARDLHDTILQSAEGLILNVHSAIDAIPASDPIRVRLESSLDQASALTSEGRGLVQSLRTFSPTELAQALKRVAEEANVGSKMACNVQALGTVRGLKPAAWDELFRIAREAIGNACRHSGASELGVEVDYAERGLFIRITDNGKGIPDATLQSGSTPGHWGLQGMHERAREVGAEIKITSRSHEGTSIVVYLGARLAYERRG